ncbi:hypothetical protein AURANDRAFT_68662, partial [Aureococcus anophagefferens]
MSEISCESLEARADVGAAAAGSGARYARARRGRRPPHRGVLRDLRRDLRREALAAADALREVRARELEEGFAEATEVRQREVSELEARVGDDVEAARRSAFSPPSAATNARAAQAVVALEAVVGGAQDVAVGRGDGELSSAPAVAARRAGAAAAGARFGARARTLRSGWSKKIRVSVMPLRSASTTSTGWASFARVSRASPNCDALCMSVERGVEFGPVADGGDCGCEAWPLARGHAGGRGAPAPSVDVSRQATRGGRAATRQTHVPDRHLRGLLPDALLDAYAFWRNADDASLCGYARAAPADAVVVVALDGASARARSTCWHGLPTLSPVLSFNCTTYDTRVQVLQVDDDSDMYGVASLEVTTGEYDILWDVDWFDGHVNAVGLYAPEGEGTYAWGTFGGCLCKFYRVRTQRLDAPLEEEKPNVDAVLGGDDDYSKDVGLDERGFYWVENIRDDEPVFHSGVEFLVSEDLYEEAVLDVATVSETGGQVWIDDDLADGQVWIDDDLVDGSYLFRLGGAFEIFVGKIITGSGYPETYADGDQEFGAAFTFYDPQGDVHVLFSSNQGSGVYELALPIAIPDGCWNTGVDTSSRAGCSAAGAQPINYIDPSDETDSNDGMDCPYDLEMFVPSAAPTRGPSFSPIEPFDRAAHSNPVQVLQVDDESDMYSVAELDVATGEYEVHGR